MATTSQPTSRNGAARSMRLALTRSETARALGVSVDFFDEHVSHELRSIRRGRRRLYPVVEIQRWIEASAERAHLPA